MDELINLIEKENVVLALVKEGKLRAAETDDT